MKLSLTLPTLFPEPAMRAIENVRATVRDMDYEIVVVSPFEVSGPNIVWVKEETPRGAAAAHAAAYESSTGDLVVALTDDIALHPGWAETGYEALLEHERGRPYAIGIGQTNLILGTVFGIYYPFFPMVRSATLQLVGGFFSPRYTSAFNDADLAFRIWSAGGECGFTEKGYIDRLARAVSPSSDAARQLEESRAAAAVPDTRTFVSLWGARYGQGWTTDDYRDFNIDVDPIFRHLVATGNTIYFNSPLFKQAHQHYAQMMHALHHGRAA